MREKRASRSAVEDLVLSGDWRVPARDLSVRFVRSGGPGGQNVNKVATKVDLRLALDATASLYQWQKAMLRQRYPGLITREGELVISADEHRSQPMNLEAARARLAALLLSVRFRPKPRKKTRPSRGQKQRRLDDKHRRSKLKQQRRGSFD